MYLRDVARQISYSGGDVSYRVIKGNPAEEIVRLSNESHFDLLVMTTFGKTPTERMLSSVVTYNVIFQTTPPLLIVRPIDDWRCRRSDFKKILVPLDGSPLSEQCIPFVMALALRFHSEVRLLSVPEEEGNTELKASIENYLSNLVAQFEQIGIQARHGGVRFRTLKNHPGVCKKGSRWTSLSWLHMEAAASTGKTT